VDVEDQLVSLDDSPPSPRDGSGEPLLSYGKHWSDWRSVAEGVLRSTPRDRQSESISYAHELAEKELHGLAETKADRDTWMAVVTKLFADYVEPNIRAPGPHHLDAFMWGLWDDDWSTAFDWTLHDDEANVVRALGIASTTGYRPYQLFNVLHVMGLDLEDTVSSEEAMLFLQQRVYPWCKSEGDRAVFLDWHADCAKKGVFAEAEKQRLLERGTSDKPIVL